MLFSGSGVAKGPKEEAENFGVDYVISYRYEDSSKEQYEVEANFAKLIQVLTDAGLSTTVREGANSTLLVFIKANKTRLIEEIYYSR